MITDYNRHVDLTGLSGDYDGLPTLFPVTRGQLFDDRDALHRAAQTIHRSAELDGRPFDAVLAINTAGEMTIFARAANIIAL